MTNLEKFEELRLNFLPRFWNKNIKYMCYPNIDFSYYSKYMEYTLEELLDDEDFIMMKPTGLKDKNGKIIYEGDVISYTLNSEENFKDKITCIVEKNGIINSNTGTACDLSHLDFEIDAGNMEDCEIIGNKYEVVE